jgi:hypothetical protein
LRLYAETALKIPHCNEVVETLLAASKFGKLSSRQQLLTTAAELQKVPAQSYLQAEIVYRQSVLLRYEGKICDSRHLIRDFLNGPPPPSGTRSHFVLGLLHLSQANNQAYNFEFSQAHQETQKWQLSDNTPFERQVDVLWDQICCTGRILRGEGRFEEAKCCFEGCLAAVELPESKRILIKSTLADLYCELDYLQYKRNGLSNPEGINVQKVGYLEKAKDMVEPEVEQKRARNQYSKGFRRLLLALIEIEIKRYRLVEAETLIVELLAIYNRLTEPDIIDRLGHVRALIAWARTSPFPKAEEHWISVLRQNAIYNPCEEDVFTCGVVYLFISLVRFHLQQIDRSRAAFCRAMHILDRKKPQFLLPGVGTYLFDFVQLELQSVAAWQLP